MLYSNLDPNGKKIVDEAVQNRRNGASKQKAAEDALSRAQANGRVGSVFSPYSDSAIVQAIVNMLD